MSPEFLRRPLAGGELREESSHDDLSSPELFLPPTQEEKRQYYYNLDEAKFSVSGHDVPREQARKAYAELHAWNRESYDRMVELLEPLFLEHIERAAK